MNCKLQISQTNIQASFASFYLNAEHRDKSGNDLICVSEFPIDYLGESLNKSTSQV